MTAGTPTAPAETPRWGRILYGLGVPLLAVLTALALGALAMWITGADPIEAYRGLLDGALLKRRSFGESLVATTPYLFLALGVGFGFRCGLFNIGVEGQYYIGQIAAVLVGTALAGLPLLLHLPLTIVVGALAGGLYAALAGFLKVRFGAHEVITTMMMNYIAILLADYLVGLKGPMRNPKATVPQSRPIAATAQLPRFNELPGLMEDPLMRIVTALFVGLLLYLLVRLIFKYGFDGRLKRTGAPVLLAIGAALTVGSWVLLGNLQIMGGAFIDKNSRLHVGILMAVAVAVFMWWLLYKTTLGFQVRTVGSNRDAAEYAGISVTRSFVIAMLISGSMAGLAGTVEVIGLDRVLKSFFSAGYGFDSIAIALLANKDPLATIPSALLFGALRNGADLMELRAGVSKNMISIVQALILMFVAAPAVIRFLFRIKAPHGDEGQSITRGWGK